MIYKYAIVLLLIFSFQSSIGQRTLRTFDGNNRNMNSSRTMADSMANRASNNVAKNLDAKIEDYKIISRQHDTIYLDTTLTIQKEYKFNYLRRDYFNLLPLNNMGQAFNSLSYDLYNRNMQPGFGSKAKHFNYMGVNEIHYFHVPTPLTELMFKTSFEQGQLLDAFFTVNTSEQFNFSIAYKGMRSLGKYQHILSSSGNFRFTSSYHSKNKRYYMRMHLVNQGILNQENGGISEEQLVEFENGNSEFTDRSVFDPLFEDAESNLEGRRFYLDHSYLLKQQDSLGNHGLTIGNVIHMEDKLYQFNQSSNSAVFGDAFVSSDLSDKNTFDHFYTEINAAYNNNILGFFKAKLGYNQFNYGYNSLAIINGQEIGNRLKESVMSFEGGYKNQIGAFLIDADLGINVAGDLEGNFLDAKARYQFSNDIDAWLRLNLNSSAADYNYRLYQSDYLNYNWQNNFKNQQSQQLAFELNSKKYGQLSSDFTSVNNYLYFENQGSGVKPYQFNGNINYLRVKYEKEFKFKKFGLYNTVLYQQVLEGGQILNIPQINSRHTFYYADEVFKKAMYLQTGINFSYFSKYNMNAYDPVLAEFYTQNDISHGNFPRIDFFLNAKIQQTRIFLKAEHFNSSLTGYNYYSAPNYPYRDFVVRFGLVWNFFL